jgi:hypothetical protein
MALLILLNSDVVSGGMMNLHNQSSALLFTMNIVDAINNSLRILGVVLKRQKDNLLISMKLVQKAFANHL